MLTEEDKALYAEQFTNENINFIWINELDKLHTYN